MPFPCLHLECSCRHGPLQCSWSVLSVNEVAITCLSISFLFSPSPSLACLPLECSCRHEPLCYSESVLAINKERLRAFPFACLHLECSCRHGPAMLFRVSSVGEWRIKYMPFDKLLLSLLLVFISNVVVDMGCYISESVLAINKERLRAFPFPCLHLECSCRHGPAMLFRVSSSNK